MLATPNQTAMTLSESHGATGRPLVHLHSTGDILLTAPNGRVHIQSLIFTQEIGNPADNFIPGAHAPAPLPPVEDKHSWLGGFALGLFDSTVGAIGTMIAHPINTVEGLAHAAAHPIDTAGAVGTAVWNTGKGVLGGDGYAAGTAVGTVGTFLIPGAGEADAVADASKLSEVADVSDASKLSEAAEPLALPAPETPALPAPEEPLALSAPEEPVLPAPAASPGGPADNLTDSPTPGASRLEQEPIPDFNSGGGKENCGACSDSVDDYLKGGDFTPADPNIEDWPQNAPGNSPLWQANQTPTSIESTLSSAGDKAQGIVYVQEGADAHVFNAYNSEGNIWAIDGQSGATGSIESVAAQANYPATAKWAFHPTGFGK